MKKLLALLLISTTAWALSGQFTWQAPVEREDGTPLLASEIAGYHVYVNGQRFTQTPVQGLSYPYNLPPGTHNLNATTVDTDGRESIFSVTTVKTIEAPVSFPKPPTGMDYIKVPSTTYP